eukprot:TRINITY_DN3285_c0_g1_i9.p1 TRINITY_DN3285_c0_g1~~TRINITY_DN3285_c0_g1_i9.p1  ORF type:complete len:592 (-),score=116.91 TRINITY_DN3285_c0_g1_i9:199-1974(-)
MESANKTTIKSGIDFANFKQKIIVSVSYQNFLYKTLERVLEKLSHKGVEESERNFIEHFLALAYFRVPEFRERLLACLTKGADLNIEEWKLVEQAKEVTASRFTGSSTPSSGRTNFLSLFDWDKEFYQYIKNDKKGIEHQTKLMQILSNEDWSKRLAKRGLAYFYFLKEWSDHVYKTLVFKDHIPWQDIPGYRTLVLCFLYALKNRDIRHFPEAMISVSTSLLHNERLFNPFFTIIFKKTSLYDSVNVCRALELVSLWFKTLERYSRKLPNSFDYAFFFKGIFLILESEHAICISQALIVIYNHLHFFPDDVKKEFAEYFFGKMFFKLFLHWSHNVRYVCHYLLVYRFHHMHRENKISNDRDFLTNELNFNSVLQEDKKRKLMINDFIRLEIHRVLDILSSAKQKCEELVDQNQTILLMGKTIKSKYLLKKAILEKVKNGDLDASFSNFSVLNSSAMENVRLNNPQEPGLPPPSNNHRGSDDLSSRMRLPSVEYEKSEGESNPTKVKHRITRKLIYFDAKENKFTEIPKEYHPYILIAWKEYLAARESYERWCGQANAFDDRNSELNPLPELIVRVPLDDSETNTLPNDEW